MNDLMIKMYLTAKALIEREEGQDPSSMRSSLL